MRLVSLLIAFCFSLNVMASTGTVQALNQQMDEYNYALSVEWDQKDQAFYDAETKKFLNGLSNLIKEGLSQEEIMKVLEQRVQNRETLEALKLKVSLLAKNASAEELQAIIRDSAKDMYSQGASWNGQILVSVAIWAVVIGVIAYAVWWDNTHECVEWDNQYVCTTYDNCYYSGGSVGGYHYDQWGNWVQYGFTCYGPSTTTCGYQDVCTRYAKKQ